MNALGALGRVHSRVPSVGHTTLIRAPVFGPMIPMSSMFTRVSA